MTRAVARGVVLTSAALGVAWWARAPRATPPPYLVRTRPTRIAHRGASAHAPENTVAAFELAGRLGADAVELDLHLTRDGHAVAHHDATLDRTTDGTGPLAARTLADLRRLDAGRWFTEAGGTAAYAGEGLGIPTLDEALDAVDGFCLLELKAGGAALADEVARVLRARGAGGRVLVASRSDELLTAFRARAPEVPTGLAEGELRRLWGLSRLRLSRWARLPGVAVQVPEHAGSHHVTDAAFVDGAHALGLHVHVWPVNEPTAMHRLLDTGVDGIITDAPDVLNDVLRRRGDPRLVAWDAHLADVARPGPRGGSRSPHGAAPPHDEAAHDGTGRAGAQRAGTQGAGEGAR